MTNTKPRRPRSERARPLTQDPLYPHGTPGEFRSWGLWSAPAYPGYTASVESAVRGRILSIRVSGPNGVTYVSTDSYTYALKVAAAPELLAALEAMVQAFDGQTAKAEVWASARSAIAKAKGE